MRWAAVAAAVSLLAIAVLARSWVTLAILLMVAGVVSSSMQPASNLFLSRRIPDTRQGLAFGIKQAAVPAAALLGGLAVPAIALTIGWRWAFVFAAVFAAGTIAVLPHTRSRLAAYRAGRESRTAPPVGLPLVVLATGFFLGIFAANGLTAFLVTSAVASGIADGHAGLLAAVAGAVAVTVRVVVGHRADHRGRAHFPVVALMLVIGVAGYGALAAGSATGWHWLFMAGAVIAFGAGWGWNGLFNFAVVRTHRDAPARATSITQVGGRLAGVAGPIAFGLVATHASYATAWSMDGSAALVGAAVILIGRHHLVRALADVPPVDG